MLYIKKRRRRNPEVVLSCIKYLQALAINTIDLDAKGIAFEKFMQDFFKCSLREILLVASAMDSVFCKEQR